MDFLTAQGLEYLLQLIAVIFFIILFVSILYHLNNYLSLPKKRIMDELYEPKEIKEEIVLSMPISDIKEPEETRHEELTKKLIKVGLKKEQIEKLKPHLGKNN